MAFRKKSATPPPPPPPPRTLFEKIWDSHVVHRQDDGTCVIYVDRHLVHEVTSPQAFEGLRMANRLVRRPDATVAVADHNTPTTPIGEGGMDEESRIQVETLEKNVADFGVPYFDMNDARRGIVHVIGPEQGLTLPGMTIVCGDSHTSTHGAFGALAFGIGTSEVEHVLATQTLIQRPAKNMRVAVEGSLPLGITPKDVILAIIGKLGTAGGTGYVVEYAGRAIREMTMEGRMTVCNMSIEAGARAGMIAPDETTFAYLEGRPRAPQGERFGRAVAGWRALPVAWFCSSGTSCGEGTPRVELMICPLNRCAILNAVVHCASNDPFLTSTVMSAVRSMRSGVAGNPLESALWPWTVGPATGAGSAVPSCRVPDVVPAPERARFTAIGPAVVAGSFFAVLVPTEPTASAATASTSIETIPHRTRLIVLGVMAPPLRKVAGSTPKSRRWFRYARARFSNFVYWPRKARLIVSVGPFRCFSTMISASPFLSDSWS